MLPLKWVGGKQRLLNLIKSRLPSVFNDYHEPFLGGGSVYYGLFDTLGIEQGVRDAYLSDINADLINVHLCTKYGAYLEHAVQTLAEHDYYTVRDAFNDGSLNEVDDPDRAAAFIYLNRAGFNGLYRENKNGVFNVPKGSQRAKFPTAQDYDACWDKMRWAHVQAAGIFDRAHQPKPGDFVYLDPPYLGTFSQYAGHGFDTETHLKLKALCRDYDHRDVKWMMSNSDCPDTRSLYSEFTIESVTLSETVGRSNRKPRTELLIRNY